VKLFAAALFFALAACSPQAETGPAETMADMPATPVAGPIASVGVVTAIDPAAGTITLNHQAIDAISWPPMTMRFTAEPASLLEGLAIGDHVAFELESAENPHTVTTLRKQ
jgi:Cu(I)/Ag(I) efflux system periplasmic protein CusF